MTSADREAGHENAAGIQQKILQGIHTNPHVPFFQLMTRSMLRAG
jgi:hypothetical protein